MLNNWILEGRLLRQPELKTTGNGKSLVNLSVASKRNFVSDGVERESNKFFLEAWGKTAEFISNNFRKGQLILLEIEPKSEVYTSADGKQSYAIKNIVKQVYFCGYNKNDFESEIER